MKSDVKSGLASRARSEINGDISRLICPLCGAALEREVNTVPANSGIWLVDASDHRFPVLNGVPCLLPKVHSLQSIKSISSFNFQYGKEDWIFDYDVSRVERILPRQFGICPEDVRGRDAVVVGCGSGAEVSVLATFGARSVIGFDLTDAIGEASRRNAANENVTVAQADATYPPVKKESFDIVFCDGVIPHTKDPEATLLSVLALVGPGGTAYIRTLLAPESLRQKLFLLPRLAVRRITTRLSNEALWRLCGFFGAISKIPILATVARYLFLYYDPENSSRRITQLINFRMYGDHEFRHRMQRQKISEIAKQKYPSADVQIKNSAFIIRRTQNEEVCS